jgi:hypothetical protein
VSDSTPLNASRRGRAPTKAREPLRRGLQLAGELGARALAVRAREEPGRSPGPRACGPHARQSRLEGEEEEEGEE